MNINSGPESEGSDNEQDEDEEENSVYEELLLPGE